MNKLNQFIDELILVRVEYIMLNGLRTEINSIITEIEEKMG